MPTENISINAAEVAQYRELHGGSLYEAKLAIERDKFAERENSENRIINMSKFADTLDEQELHIMKTLLIPRREQTIEAERLKKLKKTDEARKLINKILEIPAHIWREIQHLFPTTYQALREHLRMVEPANMDEVVSIVDSVRFGDTVVSIKLDQDEQARVTSRDGLIMKIERQRADKS